MFWQRRDIIAERHGKEKIMRLKEKQWKLTSLVACAG
jgi:hypothetical protein